MITKHNIPCSTCGKVVERYVFCSGACRVKGHRERSNTDPVVTIAPVKPQVTLTKKSKHYNAMLNTFVDD